MVTAGNSMRKPLLSIGGPRGGGRSGDGEAWLHLGSVLEMGSFHPGEGPVAAETEGGEKT